MVYRSDVKHIAIDDGEALHFDHTSPAVTGDLNGTLARIRSACPVARSNQLGGFWLVTGYDEVLQVAQDWRTFSSERGVAIPATTTMVVSPIPELIDPPLHREYKRLINAYFTPKAVEAYAGPTRTLVNRLIDGFIDDGRCEFMEAFARPFPGLAFFELVLGAPSDRVAELNAMATGVSDPHHPDQRACWVGMLEWINEFVAQRRVRPGDGDVVDAVLLAEIDGRPIRDEEIQGIIQLLILGGLETTAGALGQFIIRFAREPRIPELLHARPELIPAAVEELLRLEPPFVFVGRTATCDSELAGHVIREGEKVMISWAAANRDGQEFPAPDTFDLSRASNRHIAFGAGPHRCAGSNLARLNLRIALEEITRRLGDIRLEVEPGAIGYHSAFNRAPLEVPLAFTRMGPS